MATVHTLFMSGDTSNAMEFFERGYRSGRLPVWKEGSRGSVLDLHAHNQGVSSCAVLYFLKRDDQGAPCGAAESLGVIVGRQNHARSKSDTPLGESMREFLRKLGVHFDETNLGGMLIIPASERQ